MHVEYGISFPNHDWVVADQHKLIPSVYAGFRIMPDGLGNKEAVSNYGSTYVAIRSAKHSSSTAMRHGLDFERLLHLKEFEHMTRSGIDRLVKPAFVFIVDRGLDENPRYQKVIKVASHHFVQHDLDALFIAANVLASSASNRVERKMASLSRELSGLILQHDHYGSHYDKIGNTVDLQLGKRILILQEKLQLMFGRDWYLMGIQLLQNTSNLPRRRCLKKM